MGKYVSIRSGASALPEQSVAHLTTDLIYQSGVRDKSGGDWEVSAHNPNDLSVDIAVGRGYFKKTSICYHGYSDAVENLPISANNSGNTRIDAVVAYVDLSEVPNSDASNVLKFVVVEGTPASSPSPPSDDDIQGVIGSGNPFIRLANVTVADGASAISDSDISDQRPEAYVQIPASIYETLLRECELRGTYQTKVDDSDASTITFDLSKGNIHSVTLRGNRSLQVTNVKVGQIFIIRLKQDSTGSRTVNWWSGIKWVDGVEPVLTTTPNKTDVFGFICVGEGSYDGFIIGQNL